MYPFKLLLAASLAIGTLLDFIASRLLQFGGPKIGPVEVMSWIDCVGTDA